MRASARSGLALAFTFAVSIGACGGDDGDPGRTNSADKAAYIASTLAGRLRELGPP